ncbi:MAG: alpha/beta hydrolase, partial [Deltaproteobacteria bacterium]
MARRLITRDVVADGIRIHLVEAGEGPALLLLHGLTATHFTWEHTLPAFADRWRVIAPDL